MGGSAVVGGGGEEVRLTEPPRRGEAGGRTPGPFSFPPRWRREHHTPDPHRHRRWGPLAAPQPK